MIKFGEKQECEFREHDLLIVSYMDVAIEGVCTGDIVKDRNGKTYYLDDESNHYYTPQEMNAIIEKMEKL